MDQDESLFLKRVRKMKSISVDKIARKYKMNHNTIRNRLKVLCDKGLIVPIALYPETYAPVNPSGITEVYSQNLPEGIEMATSFSTSRKEPKLTELEEEILNIMKKMKEKTITIFKLAQILGVHRETTGKALRSMEEKGYVISEKSERSTQWSLKLNNSKKIEYSREENKEKQILQTETIFNIIKNAIADLESQVEILSIQNKAFKNVTEKLENEKQTSIDEETIRRDERNDVFTSLSKVMGISPDILVDWYKIGKNRK
jgi:DNA-binding transcriptional MocR family regulator